MRSRAIVFSSVVLTLSFFLQLHAANHSITVFKTVTCGCCGGWVNHLKVNGLKVIVNEVPSTAEYQRKYGVPTELQSCHTAIVDGYTIEGHLPATEIQRLLKERPKANGLAVPGMPLGSLGMEAGSRRDRYQVLLFQEDGRTSVYRECPAR